MNIKDKLYIGITLKNYHQTQLKTMHMGKFKNKGNQPLTLDIK